MAHPDIDVNQAQTNECGYTALIVASQEGHTGSSRS